MNYGIQLKTLREEQNLTQEETAKLINIKRSLYNQYEQQYDIIPIYRLNDLANVFDVSIDYLLQITSNRKYLNNKKEISLEDTKTRLKEFRKEHNLTQQKLASILNTNQSVIANYERGRNIIATPFLYTICKKYNISADYLLGKSNIKELHN